MLFRFKDPTFIIGRKNCTQVSQLLCAAKLDDTAEYDQLISYNELVKHDRQMIKLLDWLMNLSCRLSLNKFGCTVALAESFACATILLQDLSRFQTSSGNMVRSNSYMCRFTDGDVRLPTSAKDGYMCGLCILLLQ